jgi:MFS family permease
VSKTDHRQRWYWTLAIFGFTGITAMGFQMRGALLPSLQESFMLSESLLGLVATAGTVGFICTILATGIAAGRIDIQRASGWSAVVVGASMLGMAFATTFGLYLGILFIRGVATGPFRALDRAILGHLYSSNRGRIFNLYAMAWAAGAAIGPLVVTAALVAGNWRFAYLVLAVGFVPVVILLWRLELPDAVRAEESLTLDHLRTLLQRRSIAGMGIVLALNGGVEGSLFTWLPYLAAQSFDTGTANLLLTAYLLAYVPGRLTHSYAVDWFDVSLTLVVVLAICTIPVYFFVVFVAQEWMLFVAAGLLGFVISGIFPTLSAFGVDIVPNHSAPINAIATGSSYFGMATIPPIIGIAATAVGIRQALAIPLVLVCLVAIGVGVMRISIPARLS